MWQINAYVSNQSSSLYSRKVNVSDGDDNCDDIGDGDDEDDGHGHGHGHCHGHGDMW